MSWIQEWIPLRIRGKYFGSRNRLLGLISVLFIILTSQVFTRMGESIQAFQLLLGICVGMRLLSVYLITHIYTPWSRPEDMIHVGWRKRYGEVLKNDGFRLYLLFATALAFGFSIVGPFAPVYMNRFLEFPIASQTHLLILASLASAIGMPLWGRLCDIYGCRAVIATTGLIWMLENYLWAILTPSLNWILYPMWLCGGFLSGGVILGGFNLVLKLTPPALKSSAISLHLAITSVAAAIGPILSGAFLSSQFDFLSDQQTRYRLLFILQPTWVILSLFILTRVREPKSADISSFTGAFRAMRSIMVQSGVLFIANFTFFRKVGSGLRQLKK